jgi:hypothetical protein
MIGYLGEPAEWGIAFFWAGSTVRRKSEPALRRREVPDFNLPFQPIFP